MFQKLLISLFLFSISSFAAVTKPGIYHVSSDKLKVRMGPGTQHKHVYSLFHNARVTVHEVQNGWARISYYNKQTKEAKWVYAKFLKGKTAKKAVKKTKKTNKKKPVKKITQKKVVKPDMTMDDLLLKAISKSDDYKKHQKIFDLVSRRLYAEETCKIKEFRRLNGWMRLYKDKIYFIYCGGYSKKNKIYLDVTSGAATK